MDACRGCGGELGQVVPRNALMKVHDTDKRTTAVGALNMAGDIVVQWLAAA